MFPWWPNGAGYRHGRVGDAGRSLSGQRLRRAPRQIAQEIAQELARAAIPGVARVETADAGTSIFFFDRGAFFATATEQFRPSAPKDDRGRRFGCGPRGQCIVEHTNINPNRAAHIRASANTALGDTFVRLLRREGRPVEVPKHIDNTGCRWPMW